MRERDDKEESASALSMAGTVSMGASVERTLLLVLHSGPVGEMVSSTLQPECVEGLLSYARLFFAQPHAGKLSILAAAGRRVQTVTSWDPGQQSVEAIVQGLAYWKAPEVNGGFDIERILKEAIRFLFQPSGGGGGEMTTKDEAIPAWNVVPMVRTRLVVILPQDSLTDDALYSDPCMWVQWLPAVSRQSHLQKLLSNWGKIPDYQQLLEVTISLLYSEKQKPCGLAFHLERGAGGGIHVYHKMMVEALAGLSGKENDIEICHALFLDLTMSESTVEPVVISTAAQGNINLSTTYYKLLPFQAVDLFIDLAYFHLELSAVIVKGILPHLLETSGGDVGKLAVEMKDDHVIALEAGIRLVICESKFSAVKTPSEGSLVPGSPAFREVRTTALNYMNSSISTSQLLALPCASIAPTLPEVFQRGPSAKLWEILKNQDSGKLVLALSSEDDPGTVSHLFIWRDGRFWLHTLTRLEDRVGLFTTGAQSGENEALGDNELGPHHQDSFHPTSEVLLITTPRKASTSEKTSRHSGKKRKQEETNDSVLQASQNQAAVWRNKRSPTHQSKQMEQLSRWFPAIASDTVVGALESHSTSLATLVSPIRGAFVAEEPTSDYLSNASRSVAKLVDLTEKNDLSVFPLSVDTPAARKELYKKVWRELDTVAKQTQDKTCGQEDLANAIADAGIDLKVYEEKVVSVTPHPALEKPVDFAPVNKRRRCEEVPRDAHGRPVFPIKLGPSLQVYDLGKIVWNRPNFHSEKYIWPAGYKSRRAYASMLNPENRIFYWCEIIDDGQAPEFRLTPEDDQNNPVVGISATAVWTVVVKRVGALRIEEGGKKTFANVSGPEYFGYANPTIARLIQQLPNAGKCTKYRRQEYLPNVPMRTSETETGQGTSAPECPVSPLGRDPTPQEGPASSHSGDDANQVPLAMIPPTTMRENVEGGAQPMQEDATPMEVDEDSQSPAGAGCKEEDVKPISWLTEFRTTKKTKEVGKFPKQFAGCNPGSLFNHYWSAKLRRLRTIELDGRK